jgi:hypothetical protein
MASPSLPRRLRLRTSSLRAGRSVIPGLAALSNLLLNDKACPNLDGGRVLRYYTLTRAPTALVTASGWAKPRGCFHCIVPTV